MKITGEATLVAPVEQVWDALLDPAVLVRTIPGCERLEETADNTYDMTVTAGVASIRGTYAGTCRLSDLTPHESLMMNLQGAGAPGTVGADVAVRFEGNPDGTTTLFYDADAVVGGMVGGVGQRMLTSVSRRMAARVLRQRREGDRGRTGGRGGSRDGRERAVHDQRGDAPRRGGRSSPLPPSRRPSRVPAPSRTSSSAWPSARGSSRSACSLGRRR